MHGSYKKHSWLPLILAVTFVAGLWLGWFINKPMEMTPGQKNLQNLLNIIKDNYVDEIDLDSLIERSIPGILSNLDPHSSYLSPEDKQQPDELEGRFGGIGIQFQIYNDTVCVIESMVGGPANKVGVMAGDRILSVDGKNIAGTGITNEDVFKILRGQAGSNVKITVKRQGASKILTFDITRGNIPVQSIDAAYMLDTTTGYIKINNFGRSTYAEFIKSMNGLLQQGASNYVIDLRGNTGGYMEPAILMVNEFLPANKVIVSTKGRKAEDNTTVMSDGRGQFKDASLVVLTDEATASSSEIFSGAIQDNDRGLIIGRRTFGKGLVQRPIPLPNGGEIRLTVQRYYTPSGRSIQKDYVPGKNTQYELEIYERYKSGEMISIDSVKLDKKHIFKTASGREVYGGGGIMPDIYMPTDTTAFTGYFVNAYNDGLFQKFAYEFCDLNRGDLKDVKNLKELLSRLPADNVLLSSFVAFAVQNGHPARWYYINISQRLIVRQLKALIARDVLGIPAYFEVINGDDVNVKKAIEVIHNGKARSPIRP